MQHKLVQRVGNKDYHAEYQVEGDKVVVTFDGHRAEEKIGFLQPLYLARDLLRTLVRDSTKNA